MSRCSGHCCKRFFLPLSPAELEKAVEAVQRKERGEPYVWIDRYGQERGLFGTKQDIETITDMVIVVEEKLVDGDRSYFYTCKNLQPNGDCGIYETRPRMCSDYPYGKHPCPYPGCTFVDPRDDAKLLTKA